VGFSGAGGRAGALRCNDERCAGGDETIATTPASPYPARDVYADADGSGRTVLGWIAGGAGDTLRIARCDDAACTTPVITDVEWSGDGLDLLGMEVDRTTNTVTILYTNSFGIEPMKVFTLT
jgi:hypothetical protein